MNATGYMASLVLADTQPPWVNWEPAPAPGGSAANFSWQLMQTTLLHWSENALAKMGVVQGLLQKAVGQNTLVRGCVGQTK